VKYTLATLTLALSAGFAACAETAPVADAAPEVSYAEAAVDTENWRAVDPENLFVYETSKGTVMVEALPVMAPNHVDQFRKIIRSGKYNGTTFHRVLKGFMAQGGDISLVDPEGSGLPNLQGEFVYNRKPADMSLQLMGGADSATDGFYMGFPMQTQSKFLAEMNTTGTVESWIPHCATVVSTARTDDPNSANSQFFWMRGRSEHLDRTYTAWGRVVSGYENVKSIKPGSEANNGTVRQPDILVKASVAADMGADAPKVLVQRTDGPDFLAKLAETDQETEACDLGPVPVVVAP